jgi:hypothetical protein
VLFHFRSKLKPKIQVSFYFLCRVLVLEVGLLVLDIGSDFANGGKFILVSISENFFIDAVVK